MNDEMDEVISEFLIESYENLDRLDQEFLDLERDPQSKLILSSIFRTVHSIKGTSGFLGFSKLEKIAHAGENLLGGLRDGELFITQASTDALLALVDVLRRILSNIEANQGEGDEDNSELIATLTRLVQEPTTENVAKVTENIIEPTHQDKEGIFKDSIPLVEKLIDNDPGLIVFESLVQNNTAKPVQESVAINTPNLEETKLNDVFDKPGEAINTPTGAKSSSPIEPKHSISQGTIRVDVGLLDKLMTLVGELVLARNQVLQFSATQSDPALLSATQQLNLLTSELQESVMKTRMQPIGKLWSKFPRVVRDLAGICGKRVRVQMEGEDTELDKTIIEAIGDPLTHIIRNAIDHGIEEPAIRTRRGKPEEGKLSLKAFHEGGQVNIEISDDGAGINVEKVRAKVLKQGLISPEQLTRMSERELIQLIFLPGFSTAEQVTSVSGRGVGMDVVKTNIEKIGGSLDIHSELGKGSTIKIKIPLTLAIIPALVVTSDSCRYAIPQVSLLELVRLDSEIAFKSVENIHGAPVYRLRGKLLPLVYLSSVLNTGSAQLNQDVASIDIVVLQADKLQFGLVVESIKDTAEIVVKPLGHHLKSASVFAGSTIMGDGKVALILDVVGLAEHAGLASKVEAIAASNLAGIQNDSTEGEKLLLVGVGDNSIAIHLSTVARLEEFPASAIESAGGRPVVQYRHGILPLVDLADFTGGYSAFSQNESPFQVVVCSGPHGIMGLIVDRIIDVVQENIQIQLIGERHGFIGSSIIHNKMTDLLDVHAVISSIDPSFFDEMKEALIGGVR